jgi:N-carbamoylputrescine amidase
MAFRIACAQFAPAKARVDENLDQIAEIVLQAQSEGAELVVLPETSTSGYFLEGGVLEVAMSQESLASRLEERLKGKLTRPIDVVLGFYQTNGGILYNAAAYIEFFTECSRVVGVYQKFFLPTYGVFDEERFVSRGRELGVFDTRLGRVAILVCEDVWHGVMPTLCAINGAQIVLVPAASPARGFGGAEIENHDRYRRLFRAISEEHGVFCASAQLVGFEGGKGFVGGSMVVNPFGDVVAEAPVAESALLVAEIDLDQVGIARAQSPLLSDLRSDWEEVKRLVANSTF